MSNPQQPYWQTRDHDEHFPMDDERERDWQERWPERATERASDRPSERPGEREPGSFGERQRSVRRAIERSTEPSLHGGRATGYRRGFDDERPIGGPAYWENDRDLRTERALREREHFAPRGGHRGKMPLNFTRTDERIREQICEALTESDAIDPSNIDVQVKNGDVTIAGSVDDRFQRRGIEDLVENVAGVQDVQMSVKVRGERSRYARESR